MIRVAEGRVVGLGPRRRGATHLIVELDGRNEPAVAYTGLVGEPLEGDLVMCNTTAVDLRLGTGGLHLVVSILGRELRQGSDGHGMKLRYSPSQVAVTCVEETHPDAFSSDDPLDIPVIVLPLHSLLAPVAVTAQSIRPGLKIAYVMSDQGALPIAFSSLVSQLLDDGTLSTTVTAGQSFGGHHEAVTVASGLIAAERVAGADLVLVGMGPGNLGTGTRFGFAGLDLANSVMQSLAVGAAPVVCARLSDADPRDRHRGLSHHLRTALEVAPPGWRLALPQMPAGFSWSPDPPQPYETVGTEPFMPALHARSELMHSMGRGLADDPWFFRAGAAAAALALR
ncbi:MAG: DUF3866 family protein [Actinomycetota bacterium]